MKKMIKYVLVGSMLLCLAGCTDACWSSVKAYGSEGRVQCYSGTKLIYDGSSTGKIASSQQSDGYKFMDAKTNRLVEVSGNCVISY